MFSNPKSGDIAFNRHKGNEQSTAAFHVIKDKISASQERILNAIKSSVEGMTCDELATYFGATPNEISGRCSELKRDGKIYKSGTRKTRSGCSAAILKAFA
jgi:predicted HTH transcriptional regulator